MQLQWATALSKGLCSDGFRDPLEACDDGNLMSGDGCSAACAVESGYACLGGGPSVCVTLCSAIDTSASAGVLAPASRPEAPMAPAPCMN